MQKTNQHNKEMQVWCYIDKNTKYKMNDDI